MNFFVRLITFGWPRAITLAPFGIYIKEEWFNNLVIRNGERIHEAQANELLVIGWYLLLLIEFVIKLPIYRSKVYNSLSIEREANDNKRNPDYLKTREHFAQFKRLIR